MFINLLILTFVMGRNLSSKQKRFDRLINSVKRNISEKVNELYNSLIHDYQHRKEHAEEERWKEEHIHNINCDDDYAITPAFINQEKSVAELGGYIIGSYERLHDIARTLELEYSAPFSKEEIREKLENMKKTAESVSTSPRMNLINLLPRTDEKPMSKGMLEGLLRISSQKPQYPFF